jgi:homopolymeric O-antigen transport system ATP-binding protein
MAPAVTFRDVYKEYPFYQHITAGFKSFLFHLPKNIASLKKTKFIALKGISFEVQKGEVFGIIGRNGSGKSTILGLTAGVLKPDRGSVKTQGKISSLLELGAGFHPDLSGIENIVLNGILSGNTRRDMMKKMEEIIEFSELGDFVYQPLRTYSSGMHARLGFSVAVHINPEILLVDEALAVGDLNFKEKCNRKMKEFMESGATVIIVSHDMPAIAELCNRVAWIDNGTIMNIGSTRPVIKEYLRSLGIDLDMDEEEPLVESEIEPVIDEHDTKQNAVYVSESLTEPSHPQDTNEIIAQDLIEQAEPVALSWWDSPIVMHQIEELITGDPGISFYEYLKKEYSIAGLQKGLSICHKLKGLEQSFTQYHTCSSFDVVNEFDTPDQLPQKIRETKLDYYDLLLCVDILSHVRNLHAFLKDVKSILKEEGFIIALEYVGPAQFQYTEKELGIADMLYKAFDGQYDLSVTSIHKSAVSSAQANEEGAEAAVSSDIVLPTLQELFDIVAIRYFGGPLYDLIINRILHRLDQRNEKDVMLLKTIMQCEQILIKKGIFENHYAVIIGKKRKSYGE